MTRLKGITVTLYQRRTEGVDPFGAEEAVHERVEVGNVLVSPTASDEATLAQDLYGKKAVYTLAIPKGDAHDWEDAIVEFFGASWQVIGFVTQGIDDLIPLSWNKKVMVERYG